MTHAEKDIAGFPVPLLDVPPYQVGQGPVSGLIRLHYLRTVFIHHDEVIILVQYPV